MSTSVSLDAGRLRPLLQFSLLLPSSRSAAPDVHVHEALAHRRLPSTAGLSGVDDISPADFVAYWCSGGVAVHVNAGTWHQPLFPVVDGTRAHNKQVRGPSKAHKGAC